MKPAFLILAILFFQQTFAQENETTQAFNFYNINESVQNKPVSILFPRPNQKVRGEIKIYGKARPGAVVKLQVTSTYYKKLNRQEKIYKGEGPVKRMNRSFSITADRNGNWILKSIELTNSGWEENFTIRASADDKTATVNVYDHTRPVTFD